MNTNGGTTVKPVTAGVDGKGNTGGAFPFGPVVVRGNPKQTYSPWLVVRYAPGDIGDRPLTSGAVFWESPDVWVVSSLGINQPVPGEANQVYARVTNYGLQQANGVVVKFWWVNPSLAISEADAHPIGIAFVNIASLRTAVVPCPVPWVPIEQNGGHRAPGRALCQHPRAPATDQGRGKRDRRRVPGGSGCSSRLAGSSHVAWSTRPFPGRPPAGPAGRPRPPALSISPPGSR
jgi:hypothetical protein